MAFKVTVDRNTCIGCQACTNTCDNFEMFQGKAKPKKAKVKDVGCNKEAEGICPVQAIKVEEV